MALSLSLSLSLDSYIHLCLSRWSQIRTHTRTSTWLDFPRKHEKDIWKNQTKRAFHKSILLLTRKSDKFLSLHFLRFKLFKNSAVSFMFCCIIILQIKWTHKMLRFSENWKINFWKITKKKKTKRSASQCWPYKLWLDSEIKPCFTYQVKIVMFDCEFDRESTTERKCDESGSSRSRVAHLSDKKKKKLWTKHGDSW